jgi:hypothetical protein
MNATEFIKVKQISWADRKNIRLIGSESEKGREVYVKILDDNFFHPLLPETRAAFEKGDGNELQGDSTHSPKMAALHSSSALGVNVLQYWKTRIPDLAYSLGLCRKDNKSAAEIHFEEKFVINEKFSHSPNIDAVIFNGESNPIKAFGIECKFSEAYSSRNHNGLKKVYLTEIPEQWEDIPNLLELAKTISPEDKEHKYLHAAQLVKHILGLKRKYGKNGFRLLYLWYDVPGPEGTNHRQEIEKFAEIAKKDGIKFHSKSFQELIVKMKKSFYAENKEYLDYITDRYL